MATRAQLAHLLRRATFGPRADEVDAAERAGYDATLANLLTPSTVDAGAARTPAPKFETDPLVALAKGADRATRQKAQQDLRQQVQQIVLWWLDRLAAAGHQLAGTFASQRPDGGDKTILGRTGAFDTDGYADLLLAQPAHPKFLAARLWYRFASGEPLPDDVAGRLADAYRAHDVTALAKALFTD